MKVFTKKGMAQKIIIAILIVLLFQMIWVQPVHADVVQFGGKLLSPIMSLFVSLCDGINDILASSIMGNDATLVHLDLGTEIWATIVGVITGIVVAALAIVAIAATAGAAAAVIGAIGGTTAMATIGAGTVVIGLGAGLVAGRLCYT